MKRFKEGNFVTYEDGVAEGSYGEFKNLLKNPDVSRSLKDFLIQTLGPLTVAERWNLFGEYGFAETASATEGEFLDLRGKVDWQGSSEDVAMKVYDRYTGWEHPADVLLVNMFFEINPSLTEKHSDFYSSFKKLVLQK